MGAAAHSVTFDAGRASPFFAIDDRHSGVVDGRMRSWVLAKRQRHGGGPRAMSANETKQRPTASQGTQLVGDKDTG